jgi:hypothetical protein
MPVRPELILRLPNSPGALAEVCRILSGERVNVIALAVQPTGTLHLVVDNHVRALGALRDAHQQVSERDVLATAIPNAPGALAAVLQGLAAAGINLEYAYATSAEGSATALAVLGVPDPRRAALAAGL